MLVRRADIFPKTPENKRVLGRALGDGLLTAEGAHWRWQRRAAAPAFQPAKLAALAPPIAGGRPRDARPLAAATGPAPCASITR